MIQHKKLLLVGIVVLGILGVLALLVHGSDKVANNEISATVTNVIDKPNIAEDGYYEITVEDSKGKTYKIDATGYLNTPVQPREFGEECVNIPKVQVGDKVQFNLPRSEKQPDFFISCYEQGLQGYYVNVI